MERGKVRYYNIWKERRKWKRLKKGRKEGAKVKLMTWNKGKGEKELSGKERKGKGQCRREYYLRYMKGEKGRGKEEGRKES